MTIDLKNHKFSPCTVVVSRVQRVIDNPYKIAPISCTIVSLLDSYTDLDNEGDNFYETIAGSKVFGVKVLKGNAGLVVDMSKLRPKGSIGSGGLVCSGVTNFMAGYSLLAREVARGNSFKKAAVVLALDFTHPDFEDFLAYPKTEIPWAKMSVTINEDMWLPEYAERREKLYKAVAAGSTFVYKEQFNSQGIKLYTNVCHGLSLLSRSTCTLAHVNLGLISDPSEIPQAMLECFLDLDVIWNYFNQTHEEHFLPPEQDKQVGLGYVGLANMLAYFGVSYVEFVNAMENLVYGGAVSSSLASQLAIAFEEGYEKVAREAKRLGYERVFAIEPTASCSFKQKDLRGFTCTPEISPPVCHPVTKVTRRQAQDGYQDYQYPTNVEVAGIDVPFKVYDRLCAVFQTLANTTGLAQGISYNWWLDKPVNEDTFTDWYDSPLKTIYYRWATASTSQDKTSIGEQLEGADDFWGDEDEDDIDTVIVGNNEIACECGS